MASSGLLTLVDMEMSLPARSYKQVGQGRAAGREILGYWRVHIKDHLARTPGQPFHSSTMASSPEHLAWALLTTLTARSQFSPDPEALYSTYNYLALL